MTFYDIIYKILKKTKEHTDPMPAGDILFNELKDELILSEYTFRFFLDDLETQGYIKIIKQNIIDWGIIEILQSGINYVNQFVPDEHTNVNYNNFWAFLENQIIKNTEDLLMAKEGAESHLATQIEILERQKDLANRGQKNIWDFQEKQVAFARREVYSIDKELKKRNTLAMLTANKIGGNREGNSIKYSRFDFTKQKLEPILLELAKSYGYENITPYLMELLEKIKTFNDLDFQNTFFLNVHSICEEHAKEFWSKGHREEITTFLRHARILTDVFNHTWDYYNKPKDTKQENEPATKTIPLLSIETLKNNFDKIPIKNLYTYFQKALVETSYLTDSELLQYLDCAFDKMKVPADLFKFVNVPTKQTVMKVFYDYYKNIASKPHGKQRKYAALLGDYFHGYNTNSVSTKFNK